VCVSLCVSLRLSVCACSVCVWANILKKRKCCCCCWLVGWDSRNEDSEEGFWWRDRLIDTPIHLFCHQQHFDNWSRLASWVIRCS
jgi:hypothetical protein